MRVATARVKYSPDQPRDEGGRFAGGGDSSPAGPTTLTLQESAGMVEAFNRLEARDNVVQLTSEQLNTALDTGEAILESLPTGQWELAEEVVSEGIQGISSDFPAPDMLASWAAGDMERLVELTPEKLEFVGGAVEMKDSITQVMSALQTATADALEAAGVPEKVQLYAGVDTTRRPYEKFDGARWLTSDHTFAAAFAGAKGEVLQVEVPRDSIIYTSFTSDAGITQYEDVHQNYGQWAQRGDEWCVKAQDVEVVISQGPGFNTDSLPYGESRTHTLDLRAFREKFTHGVRARGTKSFGDPGNTQERTEGGRFGPAGGDEPKPENLSERAATFNKPGEEVFLIDRYSGMILSGTVSGQTLRPNLPAVNGNIVRVDLPAPPVPGGAPSLDHKVEADRLFHRWEQITDAEGKEVYGVYDAMHAGSGTSNDTFTQGEQVWVNGDKGEDHVWTLEGRGSGGGVGAVLSQPNGTYESGGPRTRTMYATMNELQHFQEFSRGDGRVYGVSYRGTYEGLPPRELVVHAEAALKQAILQNDQLEREVGVRNSWDGSVHVGIGQQSASVGAIATKDWSCSISLDTRWLADIQFRAAPVSDAVIIHELLHGISNTVTEQAGFLDGLEYGRNPALEEGVVQGMTEAYQQEQVFGRAEQAFKYDESTKAPGGGAYSSWTMGLDEGLRSSLSGNAYGGLARAVDITVGQRLDFYTDLMNVPLPGRQAALDEKTSVSGRVIELTGKGLGTKMGYESKMSSSKSGPRMSIHDLIFTAETPDQARTILGLVANYLDTDPDDYVEVARDAECLVMFATSDGKPLGVRVKSFGDPGSTQERVEGGRFGPAGGKEPDLEQMNRDDSLHVKAQVVGASDFREASNYSASDLDPYTRSEMAAAAKEAARMLEERHDSMAPIFGERGNWDGRVLVGSSPDSHPMADSSLAWFGLSGPGSGAISVPTEFLKEIAYAEKFKGDPRVGYFAEESRATVEYVFTHEMVHSFQTVGNTNYLNQEDVEQARPLIEGVADATAEAIIQAQDTVASNPGSYAGWKQAINDLAPKETEAKQEFLERAVHTDIYTLATVGLSSEGRTLHYRPDAAKEGNVIGFLREQGQPETIEAEHVYTMSMRIKSLSADANDVIEKLFHGDPAPARAFLEGRDFRDKEALAVREAVSSYIMLLPFARERARKFATSYVKYSPDQERDERGRWTDSGEAEPSQQAQGEQHQWDQTIRSMTETIQQQREANLPQWAINDLYYETSGSGEPKQPYMTLPDAARAALDVLERHDSPQRPYESEGRYYLSTNPYTRGGEVTPLMVHQLAESFGVDRSTSGAVPITADEARGDSREVSRAEFHALADEGRQMLEDMRTAATPTDGLDHNWEALKEQAHAAVQEEWGGVTIDAHTGATVEPTTGYALSVKEPGQQTTSISEEDAKDPAKFGAAMDRARESYGVQLQSADHYLGVFHDDLNNRIDIDPVVIVDTKEQVDAIGAYTHAIGGAYEFETGNGHFPPHVADTTIVVQEIAPTGDPTHDAIVRGLERAGAGAPEAKPQSGKPLEGDALRAVIERGLRRAGAGKSFGDPGNTQERAEGGRFGPSGGGTPEEHAAAALYEKVWGEKGWDHVHGDPPDRVALIRENVTPENFRDAWRPTMTPEQGHAFAEAAGTTHEKTVVHLTDFDAVPGIIGTGFHTDSVGTEMHENGAYFATDPKTAQFYDYKGSVVVAATVVLQNPVDVSFKGKFDRTDPYESEGPRDFREIALKAAGIEDAVTGEKDSVWGNSMNISDSAQATTTALREAGFDGVLIRGVGDPEASIMASSIGGNQVVVFDKEQIVTIGTETIPRDADGFRTGESRIIREAFDKGVAAHNKGWGDPGSTQERAEGGRFGAGSGAEVAPPTPVSVDPKDKPPKGTPERAAWDKDHDGRDAQHPIVTRNVDKAAQALSEGKFVNLHQKNGASTLLDKLAAIGKESKQKLDAEKERLGRKLTDEEKAKIVPLHDLGKVTIKGTNIFMNGNLGIPRIKMPQLSGIPVPGSPAANQDKYPPIDKEGNVDLSRAFAEHLAGMGVKVTDEMLPANTLRASQSELSGVKVAGIMGAMETGKIEDPTARAIWTTSDRYIVDGHHWWGGIVGREYHEGTKDLPIHANVVDMPITTALEEAVRWTEEMGIGRAAAKRRPFATSRVKVIE